MAKMQSRGFNAKRAMDDLLDEIDEERARRLRQSYGKVRWLVSWHRGEDGGWTARLSGPGDAETIERDGRTRLEAIEEAARALRAELGTD